TPATFSEECTHFRWYTRAFADENGRRGNPHTLKMVLGPEGARRYDIAQETPGVIDYDYLSVSAANDGNLKQWCDAYIEYKGNATSSYGNARVASVFFSGECGCSG